MEIITDLGEMLNSSAMFLEILCASIPKELCRTGPFVRTEACLFNLCFKVVVGVQWTRPIRKVGALRYYQRKGEGGDAILRASDPGAMRSNPRAMAHSAAPNFTRLLDW